MCIRVCGWALARGGGGGGGGGGADGYFGLEGLAAEMEDPFGKDTNDLPLSQVSTQRYVYIYVYTTRPTTPLRLGLSGGTPTIADSAGDNTVAACDPLKCKH